MAPPVDASSLEYAEGLYADYLREPASVPEEWARLFQGLGPPAAAAPAPQASPGAPAQEPAPAARDEAALRERLERLVRAYRLEGHRAARLDPLDLPRRCPVELDPAFHGLAPVDLDRPLAGPGGKAAAQDRARRHAEAEQYPQPATPREVVARLVRTYCGSLGVQFMHLEDVTEQAWLVERMESTENRLSLPEAEREWILERLIAAAALEEFLQKRFLGAKTFSLEGAETLIPLLELAIEEAGREGVSEIVLGMAHRGRLNVLANVLGQPAREVFRMFRDAPGADGDVRYHLGCSRDRRTRAGRSIHLSLTFNPSHLEFVDPVVLGRVRAKQDRAGDRERKGVLGVLIHGDAAFAGEGVVQETLNLSGLAAYRTGGTLHVIVNNQLGFTTPPEEGRTGRYATDVARLVQAPIFHVNGEDPEAVAVAVRLAMEFRREAGRDAIVDLYCYRRRGHNETDEPSFTQPVLYRAIERRPPVRESYLEHLSRSGGFPREKARALAAAARERLEAEFQAPAEPRAAAAGEAPAARPEGAWAGYHGGPEAGREEPATAVPEATLAGLLDALTRLPPGFEPHPKVRAGLERRRRMALGAEPLDWAAAEALAFASLAAQGVRVRLAGQDSARGTFSQRHAVLFDYRDGHPYVPLRHAAPGQAAIEVLNSPLSEAAALGFEYGYSLDAPDALVLWEAQFGDFANAAQVLIDQFLASAERKWRRLSGLVLLLPHGLEGQGPEHSSARLERFLELAAEDNIQLVQPTTPAQYFHCLRRQALRRWRKPLVALTPKSLLRRPECASPLSALAAGGFRRLLVDAAPQAPARALLCTGKVCYDLLARRERLGREQQGRQRPGARETLLVRLEQLYPLPDAALAEALAGLPERAPLVWVQEEPGNMGAWPHLRNRFGAELLGRPLSAVHRPASSSPASGSKAAHGREQERLLQEAFDGA